MLGGFEQIGGAIGEMDEAYDGLEGLGQLAGVARMALPALVGGGLSLGAVYATSKLITDPATIASVKPYKWLIGAGVSTLAGIVWWKFRSPTEGTIAITSGLLASGIGYLVENYASSLGLSGAYVMAPAQPIFGRYAMGTPQPLFAGQQVNAPFVPEAALQGTIGTSFNPGIYG